MNERIQKLIRDVGFTNSDLGDGRNQMLIEFAELIVRECVSLMNIEKEYYSNPGTYESREYYERMSAKKDAFDEAASMIKSHFGVE